MSRQRVKRMVMTLERTTSDDLGPTGHIEVVGLRPATLLETALAWLKSLFKKPEPDRADLSGLTLPLGAAVSVGIALSPETYTKLVNGDTKVTQAIDLLRDSPVSMSLVMAPESMPAPMPDDIYETVV